MTEFNLSEEGVEVWIIRELEQIEDSNVVYSDKSVKEFIRLLKEKVAKQTSNLPTDISKLNLKNQFTNMFSYEIDKLAGEDLK